MVQWRALICRFHVASIEASLPPLRLFPFGGSSLLLSSLCRRELLSPLDRLWRRVRRDASSSSELLEDVLRRRSRRLFCTFLTDRDLIFVLAGGRSDDASLAELLGVVDVEGREEPGALDVDALREEDTVMLPSRRSSSKTCCADDATGSSAPS